MLTTAVVRGITMDRKEKLMGFGLPGLPREDHAGRVLGDHERSTRPLRGRRGPGTGGAGRTSRAPTRSRHRTNMEFWAAVILDFAEGPAEHDAPMFTGPLPCARQDGRHILEQSGWAVVCARQSVGRTPPRPADTVPGWNEDESH